MVHNHWISCGKPSATYNSQNHYIQTAGNYHPQMVDLLVSFSHHVQLNIQYIIMHICLLESLNLCIIQVHDIYIYINNCQILQYIMLHPKWNSRYIIYRQLRPDPVMSMVFLDLSGNPTWQWIWLVVEPTPLKNMLVRSRQLGLLFTIYGQYSCSKPPTIYGQYSCSKPPSSIIMGVLPVQFSFCSYPECHTNNALS